MASDTRNRILSVAARLFEAHGFEGTAVAAILREADVNSGSLYHFFPSKEALLVAVLEKYVETLEPALLSAAERAADEPVEKVFALLELYRGRLLVSEFTRGCPVGDLSLELGSHLPEARALVADYFAAWRARVRAWLESAGEDLARDADPEVLAAHALAVLQGGIMQARAASSIGPFDASVAQLRATFDLLSGDAGVREAPRIRPRTVTEPDPTDPVRVPAVAAPTPGEPAGTDEDAWWRAW
jgi:AcrR family transcriptional regulator